MYLIISIIFTGAGFAMPMYYFTGSVFALAADFSFEKHYQLLNPTQPFLYSTAVHYARKNRRLVRILYLLYILPFFHSSILSFSSDVWLLTSVFSI
jgi:hypothetical protein